MNKKSNNQRYKTRKKTKKSKKKYKNCNRRRNKKFQSGGSVELDDIKSIIQSGKVYGLFRYGELKDGRGNDRFRMSVNKTGELPTNLNIVFDGESVDYKLETQHSDGGGTFVLKLVDSEGNPTNTSLKYVDDEIYIHMERFVAQIFHRLDDFNEEFNMETGVNCGLMQIFSKIDGNFVLLESHPNFKKLSDWLTEQWESVEGDPEKLERYQGICVKIFWQIASQLKCLQENGFYMPDFKPSNIAIIETDIDGSPYYRVFLFDYGDLIIYIPKFIEKTSGILDSLRESTREKIEEITTLHEEDKQRLFCNLFEGRWAFNVLISSSNPLFLMDERDQEQKQMVKEGFFYITTLEQAELLNLFFLSLLSSIFVSQGRGGCPSCEIILVNPYIWLGYGEMADSEFSFVSKIMIRIHKQKSEFQAVLNEWNDEYKIIYDLASLFLVLISAKYPLFSLQNIEQIKGKIGIDIDGILTEIMDKYENLIYG